MKLKKSLILVFLFIAIAGLTVSAVSAIKYTDTCQGGDLKHKTTWNIKPVGKDFDGFIKKNGKYYKRYQNLFQRDVVGCNHPSHGKQDSYYKTHPYQYSHQGIGGQGIYKDYSYKLAKKKTTGKVYLNTKINYTDKSLGKNDLIEFSWSGNKDGQGSKHIMMVNLGYKYAEGPDDDIARQHKMIKASVKFIKGKNSMSKTFKPNKYGSIIYEVKNGYVPYYTKITYVY